MPMPSPPPAWLPLLGRQRDWVWRGWQIRYTYLPPSQMAETDALPIVLIHGFGSSLTQWRFNLTELNRSHPIYALDLLGFGASEKAIAPYKVELWRSQVYAFWQTLIRRPILLVGHSLGALVALSSAVEHPDMVQSLVMFTLPASRQELLPRWAQPWVRSLEGLFAQPWIVRPLFELVRRPPVIRAALTTAYANADQITDDLVESYVAPTRDRGAGATLCRLSQCATRMDYTPNAQALLEQVQQPTLILWGDRDRIIRLSQRQVALRHATHVKLVQVPNAGHCAYEEQADWVNHEIQAWATQSTGHKTIEIREVPG